MSTHLHFDCSSGVSGDMLLGACVDAGISIHQIRRCARSLHPGGAAGVDVRVRRVKRGTIRATKVDVIVRRGMRTPLSMERILRRIAASTFPTEVKTRGREVFTRLAVAEGRVHGVPVPRVHFHEVGVVDSLVDVMGSLLCCHLLGATRITASPINVGSGFVQTAHGSLPVPGPAVAALAEGVPIYSKGPHRELTTPTGIAVLRTVVASFGDMPPMRTKAVGYGAGDANPQGWSNVLRVFVGDELPSYGMRTEPVCEIETNLDDLNPQLYETVVERLFAVGAVDVTLTPVVMKRGRPGVVLTALADRAAVRAVADVILRDTTALGVRYRETERIVLARRFETVRVHGGLVRMKVAEAQDGEVRAVPEYTDCRRLAERKGIPVRTVMEDAVIAFRTPLRHRARPRRNR